MNSAHTSQATETHVDDVNGFYCGYQLFYAPVAGTYVVRPGDSLSAIAQRTYGDARLWPLLFAANSDRIANPHLIYPGQVLRIA